VLAFWGPDAPRSEGASGFPYISVNGGDETGVSDSYKES
jgi:hypothetical protein